MKNTKKLVGILLALVLILNAGAAALATQEGTLTGGSITIKDAEPGHTYNAYQILYLESYDATAGAYAYKANSAWESWLKTQTSYVSFDAQGYVTWVTNADAAAFAKLAQAEATKTGSTITVDGTATCAEGSTTVTISNLNLGYYLVDTTLGTLCSLDTTNPSVTMQEKNEKPTNDKDVKEGDTWSNTNDADIGDTVQFRSQITLPAGSENVTYHDTMSAGLTLTANSVKVYTNEDMTTELTTGNYTVTYKTTTTGDDGTETTTPSDGCTFEVSFTQSYLDTLTTTATVYIGYSATVNENAVVSGDGNTNKSHLSYGDSSNTKTTPESETKTYTWKIAVFKFSKENNTENPLSGATFTLSKSDNGTDPIALISKGNNVYRVAKTGETSTVTSITTDTTGKFSIEGLDAGTYYLTETAAPAGYNKLVAAIKVIIDNNGAVKYAIKQTADGDYGTEVSADSTLGIKVENKSGNLLPSTGGAGTTVFYILGSVLMLTAIVLFVTKRRMNAGN